MKKISDLFKGKYYYILGCCEVCWTGKSLEKARIVFQDEQYDELIEVETFMGKDVKKTIIDWRE